MDFFGYQDVARKKSGIMVVLFFCAVIAIVVMAYLVVAFGISFLNIKGLISHVPDKQSSFGSSLWQPRLFVSVGLGTVGIILIGTLYKIAALRGGGRVVAESLGGRLVAASSRDSQERKILNVIEEMAIASGMPVPPVYLMDKEAGINAFAAGYSPDDAVIGVTRGTMELLDRDELQGVIAHEFSHILNGDMRLNIRLIGVIHGIVIIGILGHILIRSTFYSSSHRSRSNGQGKLVFLGIGLGLMVVGSLGVFFGKLIKANISRQREFLADASAVQFTRDSNGIGGALKKIGGYTFSTTITNPRAEEMSHMFFGPGLKSMLGSITATHPPLLQRIERIDPGWDGTYPKVKTPKTFDPTSAPKSRSASKSRRMVGAISSLAGSPRLNASVDLQPAAHAIEQIGQPTRDHLEYTIRLLATLPEPVTCAAREPFGARAVVYAMLLHESGPHQKTQLKRLRHHADTLVYNTTLQIKPLIKPLDPSVRLPLIDMVVPALRELSTTQYRAFEENIRALIAADDGLDLFEWVLQRVVMHHVRPGFHRIDPPKTRHRSLKSLANQCALLLSGLAFIGNDDRSCANHAFTQGTGPLSKAGLAIRPIRVKSLAVIDGALDDLSEATPRLKRIVLEACAACIVADKNVTTREAEMLRGISDSLGCPMPPLLPGQSLT
ncbi:MAG: hypothetical protein CMJ20_08850 [Phycisphaeraceae bacterium]|nr:hypothetical protein [Phycisphaeraceae bacterium]